VDGQIILPSIFPDYMEML